MPAITGASLTALRARPIGQTFKLYVYQPALMWSGTVGGSPDQGDRELSVTTDLGNPADIISDMTCRVTDASGNLKIAPSKVRAKSHSGASPGTLTVAENAIDWSAGDRVTVYRLWEIWPRIPYIDPSSGEQFKDRNIAWTSDAQAQPPKANAGPAVIATLNGGQVDVVFQDEGSFTCPSGGAVSSHLWAAIGGTPAVVAGGLATSTVTLRYTTAGYYYVSLTVTDANGQTGVVYVPVIIDDGTKARSYVVPSDRHWDTHGWRLARRTLGLDAIGQDNTFYDGAPAFLVAADNQVTDAFIDNRASLRWSGWLMQDDTRRDAYSREVSYRAVSSAHVLASVPAYPVAFRSDAAPADWYEFTDLSINSVAYLLLRWHSTLCQVADFHAFSEDEWAGGASERLRPGENCDAEDLLSQVNAVLGAAKGNLRCDRQGVLRAMRYEWFLSSAERAARATVLTLQSSDLSRLNYGPHEHRARVRETRLSGVAGDGTPYISGSPGPSPLDGGRPLEVQRLAPLTQAELNQWAGQELALANFDAVVRLRMAGEYDCVDPALGEFVAGTLSTFDVRVPDGPYSVVGARLEDDYELGLTVGEWLLMPEPGMFGASARTIPAEPPPPPLPPPDIPPEVPPLISGTGDVVVMATRSRDEILGPKSGVVYTLDAISGNPPTWHTLNTGIGDAGAIYSLCMDTNQQSFRLACIDRNFDVYVNTDWRAGAAWSLALDTATMQAAITGASWAHGAHVDAFSVNNNTYLIATVKANVGVHWFWSDDWGGTWQNINPVLSYFSGWGVYALCSYYADYQWQVDRLAIGAQGQIAPLGNYFIVGGRGNGSQGRSCVAAHTISNPVLSWKVPCYRPSYAHSSCTGCGGDPISGGSIGSYTAPYEDTGPGGMCPSPDGDAVYAARFVTNEDLDASKPVQMVKVEPAGSSFLMTDLFRVDGYSSEFARTRGMLFTAPMDLTYKMIALEQESGPETRVILCTEVAQVLAGTIDRMCRAGKAFPVLIDDYAILYLGRSWNKTDGETASDGDEALFWVSKQESALMGTYFTDKTGNLFDLGAAGVFDIEVDTTSD